MVEGSRPVFPTVPVTVLEAALQGRASTETIGHVLGGAMIPPLDAGASAASSLATLSAGLERFGFGEAAFATRGALFVVSLAAPSFRLGALAEAFVASVFGAAAGREIGALAFPDGEAGWSVALLDPVVSAFLRAKHVGSIDLALSLLEVA